MISIEVVLLCAIVVMISCAICNYGMLKLKKTCSSKTNSSKSDELPLVRRQPQDKEVSIPMEVVKLKNKKTLNKKKAQIK